MTHTTTLTQKGQVTIPADIRKSLKLKPHQKIIFIRTKDKVELKPAKDFLALKGSIKSKKKYSDKKADKKIEEFIAKDYAKKSSRS